MESETFQVKTTCDEKLGIVTASLEGLVSGHYIYSIGGARKHDPDRYDENLGRTLATARALKEAADKLERGARREIKRRDERRARQDKLEEQRKMERKANTKRIRMQLRSEGVI